MKHFLKKRKIRSMGSAFFLLFLMTMQVFGQREITGTVFSADENEPLIGATVAIMGTSVGTITDVDGNFTIQAESGDVLVVSYVGYTTEQIAVEDQISIDVVLELSATGLEELVVIGYGSQREKDLTSAIITVDADEITKSADQNAMQALQGKAPGVQIVNSGAPGASPTVRIRGIGSLPGFGNSNPLYVVDGAFFDDISFLNPADIKSISVLKDASAAAIYGVRAANGVVLVETKSGSYNQEAVVEYSGYYGLQVPQNVIKMSNSEQFVRYINETGAAADLTFIENAMQRYGRSRVNPNVPDVNTDWYDEVMRNGPIQNHSVNVSGGAEKIRYSVGGSYFKQQGLLNVIRNEYERLNFRTKINFRASDRLEVGTQVILGNETQYNAPNSIWFNSYFAVPIFPAYEDENIAVASPEPIANAQTLGYRGTQNPFFIMHYTEDRNKNSGMVGNFFFDYDLLKDKLSFKMSYNYTFNNINTRNVGFPYSNGQTSFVNSLYRQNVSYTDQIWDNILTYDDSFGDHNLTVMAGYSFRSETHEGVFAQATEIQGLNRDQEELWYMSGPDRAPVGLINEDGTGDVGGRLYGASYLGRLAYNYDDRYLLYGTYRRDGTNKFQAKWGNFFTVGAGWVLSEEEFFDVGFFDFLKIRGSWGQLGNDKVNPAEGQPTRDAIFAAIDDTRFQGITLDNAFDLVTRWETVEESNVGLTARMLGSDLSLEADVYRRDTKDAVTLLLVPGQRSVIRRSVASLRNSGVEMAVRYSRAINNDLDFAVGANFATLHNEVLDLGPGPGYLDGGQAEFRQRSIEGEPINAFFGYEVEGVFDNDQEIQNSGLTDQFITDNNLIPGDLQFRDQNGDGVIDSDDRVVLGSYLPSFTYGMDLMVSWRNLMLTANFYGQTGNVILNRKRGEIIWTTDTNIDAELADNLWRGDGTSDRYPSAAGMRKGYNQAMSDYFLEDGSYFRIQNIQLSYTLPGRELGGRQVPDITVLLTAKRPVTVFSYNGFNPEVPSGIDRQTYPVPAVYTLGLNVRF